jgi:uncharacterized protein (TIGR02246 family)
MNTIAPADLSALKRVIAELEAAWNAGDGARFSGPFALDGDQINIFGAHLENRSEIASRHDFIFKTIFLGSRSSLRLVEARHVTSEVILARVHSTVEIPRGPLQGMLETLGSLVFRKTRVGWELVTFHNTQIGPDACAEPH